MTARDVVYSLRRVAVTAALPAALWAGALLGEPLPLTAQTAADIVSRITECADGVLLRLARPYAPLSALMVQWSAVVSSLLDPRAPLPTALGIRGPMLQHLVEHARAHPSAEEAGPYRAIHEYVRDRNR